MKGLLLKEIGDIEVTGLPEPEVAENETLVSVRACGICGSDIPRAYDTGAHKMPLVIGHEFSGVTEDGRRVGVFPLIPCGKCEMCKAGHFELCRSYDYLGSRRDGGFAELVAVPQKNLIDLPDEVSFEQAAMLEPMAVAVHAMRRALTAYGSDLPKSAAVIGTGTIGHLVRMFLEKAGVESVAQPDTRHESVSEQAYDVVFECVGKSETYETALRMARPLGVVMLVGNPHSDMTAKRDAYWQILRQQLTVLGTWNSTFPDDWQYALERVASGAIHPEGLITHRFDIDNIVQGFELMRDKREKYTKVMCVI